jgi:hypothetical protein
MFLCSDLLRSNDESSAVVGVIDEDEVANMDVNITTGGLLHGAANDH